MTERTLEDILAKLAAEGFVVSNTFQTGAADTWGEPGWQVYLRNERNTRTGQGAAATLAGAFEAAYAVAMQGPTYVNPTRGDWLRVGASATQPRSRTAYAAPPKVTLGSGEGGGEGDLF